MPEKQAPPKLRRSLTTREYRAINWGVPDWRDAAAYQATLSHAEYRWEFLRRREDYRRLWAIYCDEIQGCNRWLSGEKRDGWEEMAPSLEKISETFTEYCLKQMPPDPRITPKNIVFGTDRLDKGKWYTVLQPGGIYYAINTWCLHPKAREFKVHNQTVLLDGHAPVVIDLGKPISAQLRKAEKALLLRQKTLSVKRLSLRLHRKKFPAYLRALDAEFARATCEDIWRTIYPNSSSRNPRARGEELVQAAFSIQDRITRPK